MRCDCQVLLRETFEKNRQDGIDKSVSCATSVPKESEQRSVLAVCLVVACLEHLLRCQPNEGIGDLDQVVIDGFNQRRVPKFNRRQCSRLCHAFDDSLRGVLQWIAVEVTAPQGSGEQVLVQRTLYGVNRFWREVNERVGCRLVAVTDCVMQRSVVVVVLHEEGLVRKLLKEFAREGEAQLGAGHGMEESAAVLRLGQPSLRRRVRQQLLPGVDVIAVLAGEHGKVQGEVSAVVRPHELVGGHALDQRADGVSVPCCCSRMQGSSSLAVEDNKSLLWHGA
mmetsp:Transcript_19553/g.75075  ORF Transcript_19553/g.75075 Transcript_19553/m.75075 type:complete len:280 (-) Transcript_19553:184-1023(-)